MSLLYELVIFSVHTFEITLWKLRKLALNFLRGSVCPIRKLAHAEQEYGPLSAKKRAYGWREERLWLLRYFCSPKTVRGFLLLTLASCVPNKMFLPWGPLSSGAAHCPQSICGSEVLSVPAFQRPPQRTITWLCEEVWGQSSHSLSSFQRVFQMSSTAPSTPNTYPSIGKVAYLAAALIKKCISEV